MSKTLVLFDFDGTITRKDTFIEFLFFTKGKLKVLSTFLLFSPLIALFSLGIIDSGKVKLRMFSFLFKGMAERELEDLAQSFIEKMISENDLHNEIVEKIDEYKRNGADLYIVSASLDLWIKYFAGKKGIRYICTLIGFEERKFNGNYKTLNCNRGQKAIRIKTEIDLKNYTRIIAYGNSSADNEMFSLATEAHRV